jgi:hypothetical protein
VEIFTLISFISNIPIQHSKSISVLAAPTKTMIAFSQICLDIERRLLSVQLHGSGTHRPDAFVYDAVCIAGLMCRTYLFRIMGRRAAIFVCLGRRLRVYHTMEDLERSSTDLKEQDTMRLRLWAICVGSLTSTEQTWFVRRIRPGAQLLQMTSLDELGDCLGCFVWTTKMTSQFAEIWEQVNRSRR